jgi:hypothetical protein
MVAAAPLSVPLEQQILVVAVVAVACLVLPLEVAAALVL